MTITCQTVSATSAFDLPLVPFPPFLRVLFWVAEKCDNSIGWVTAFTYHMSHKERSN